MLAKQVLALHDWRLMKIRFSNKGLIFKISEFAPFAGYSFAQSPQLISIGENFRVYFSARRVTKNKYPESEILFVDFNSDFSEIISFSKEPVLESSLIGSYDEHGVFPINPVRLGNQRMLAYLSGWSRRVAVPVETAIGLAESFDDGVTFQRLGTGPILAASPQEPFLVGDPFVIKTKENSYKMYYIAGQQWKEFPTEKDPQRIYKIRSASSEDGVNWVPDGIDLIPDKLIDECQALPSVAAFQGQYLMSFCFREADGFRNDASRGYRLGFATSKDLVTWRRDDDIAVIDRHSSDWDEYMACYPNLTVQGSLLVLLYNGNNFGRGGFGLAVFDPNHE
jgi:hypothetical protein